MSNWKTSHWKDRLIRFLSVGVFTLLAASSWAEQPSAMPSQDGLPNDGIDRDAPDFVIASLLVMGPGDELYSCAGHAALRMECPAYNLDFCFSYESESVKDKVLLFFRGKLKMGMFAIPMQEYLKTIRESGRGITQYQLNLPIAVKRRLWELLDNKVAEGAELPYDYVKRGCSQALLVLLRQALEPMSLEVGSWPEKYEWTRREFVDSAATDYPWNRLFLHSIMGDEAERNVPKIERVILPEDLREFLSFARVSGTLVIDSPDVELLPQVAKYSAPWVTPIMVAWLFVALAVADGFLRWKGISILFLSIQFLAGLFFCYLVFISDLPATGWNWLVIPFNPLPLVFWKWRRRWAFWFVGILVAWEAYMLLSPHRLTDPAYLVLVAAYVVFYARMGWRRPRNAAPVVAAVPAAIVPAGTAGATDVPSRAPRSIAVAVSAATPRDRTPSAPSSPRKRSR